MICLARERKSLWKNVWRKPSITGGYQHLPTQEYEIPDPYAEQRSPEPSHPCSCMCVGAPSCQHQIECTSCHRCWFCKFESSQAPGGYVTRDEAKFGDFVPVSCWESSIADAHRDPLPVKDFPEYHCRSCRQVASKASWLPAPQHL